MNKTVIIQASAKSKGDTHKVITYFNANSHYDVIDLNTKNIGHYDYDYKNKEDDFLPIMRSIIIKYDVLIFATPVYWYTMSGILKVFLDRFYDLLDVDKKLGRLLRGKKMALISCSNANDLKEGFEMPIQESANYLGMNYLGHIHAWIEGGKLNRHAKTLIDSFKNKLNL